MKDLLLLLITTSAIAADEIRTERDVDYLGGGRTPTGYPLRQRMLGVGTPRHHKVMLEVR